MSRGGLRRFVAGLALGLAAIVVWAFAAEAIFRLTNIDVATRFRVSQVFFDPGHPNVRAEMGYVPFSTVRSTYSSNPRGYFDADNSIDHVHNSVGWRDVEHTLAKPPGTYRILGLGDSYLWGQGVRREDICLTRLGGMLQKHAPPGLRIETINSGQNAFNTVDERNSLRARGLLYAPDLVIVHFVPNDVEPDVLQRGPKVDLFVDYLAAYMRPDWLTQRSRLWAWTKQRCLRAMNSKAYLEQSLASFQEHDEKWTQCRDALIDIQEICRQAGAQLVVVIFPFFIDLDGDYPFQPIHDRVKGLGRERGIPVLDLREAYRDYRGPELWVHPTDEHPNEIAHGLAAKAMAEFLLAHAQELDLYHPRPSTPATVAGNRP